MQKTGNIGIGRENCFKNPFAWIIDIKSLGFQKYTTFLQKQKIDE